MHTLVSQESELLTRKPTDAALEPETGLDERQQQKRQSIVDAAVEVFARDGFSAARTDCIAEMAGVAKGTLYLYFDTKEDIFREAIRSHLLPVVQEMQQLGVDFDGSAADLISLQITNFYCRVLGSDRVQLLGLMMAEGNRFPDVAKFYFENVVEVGIRSIRATVELGVERGEFRKPEGELFHLAIMGPALITGIWKQIFDPHHPIDLDEARRSHIDMVLHALKAH
jgi:AcrR family transcriptional regulator